MHHTDTLRTKALTIALAILLLCLTPAALASGGPGDGVRLTLERGPVAGEVTITWEGGGPLFEVFRSTSPFGVADPANRLAETSDRTFTDVPPPGQIFFYQVTSECVFDPPERCDGVDNDCDGEVDGPGSEDSCDIENATAECLAGGCAIEACDTGFEDCDLDASNGCEADLLNDVVNCGVCGACGITCALPNALPGCSAGACVVSSCAPDFWDANGDSVDGCEYACTFVSAIDEPDPDFIDANCDGVDGDVARALFVSPSGSDANAGTRAAPLRTIGAALSRAAGAGATQVLLDQGTYSETVTLVNGIGLHGGCASASSWDRSTAQYSCYAILASGSPGLVVRDSVLEAGLALSGRDGFDGVAGLQGLDGTAGGRGCENSDGLGCDDCNRPSRGIGGIGRCAIDTSGGNGGEPGLGSADGSDGSAGRGTRPGNGGTGSSDGLGDWIPSQAVIGDNGASGAHGIDGLAATARFAAEGFAPWESLDGTSGADGSGGGGGGGGPSVGVYSGEGSNPTLVDLRFEIGPSGAGGASARNPGANGIRTSVFPASCGNGYPDGGEDCDDGDTIGGDGCSATCRTEPPAFCEGTPAACGVLGDVIYRHEGAADPRTEGWTQTSSVVSVEPVFGDRGLDAWRIDDNSTAGGSTRGYDIDPTTAEVDAGRANGWAMRARLRVVDRPDAADFSVWFEYADGASRWTMRFGQTADGHPIVRLGEDPEFVLFDLDDGYHLYELVFDPDLGATSEATLFVNGEPRQTGFVAPSSTLRRVSWGSGQSNSTGEGRFNLIEWLTLSCGNGALEAGEACDDGNLASGDGCSRVCTTED